MGNQQLRVLTDEEALDSLIKNAIIGDGYLWKHPECVNKKLIFTSTTPELLQIKLNIYPKVFRTGVSLVKTDTHKGRFPNAAPLYRLASTVHARITELSTISRFELIDMLNLHDLGLYYLDDGSCHKRKDTKGSCFRYSIALGKTFTEKELNYLSKRLEDILGCYVGRFGQENKPKGKLGWYWHMTNEAANLILEEARGYSVLPHKFPETYVPRSERSKFRDYPVRE
ncbi:MAG: hypothetical protein WC175_06050, partial [Candidatus Dojkabacteria bacterium]